jgi:hypothetical protein
MKTQCWRSSMMNSASVALSVTDLCSRCCSRNASSACLRPVMSIIQQVSRMIVDPAPSAVLAAHADLARHMGSRLGNEHFAQFPPRGVQVVGMDQFETITAGHLPRRETQQRSPVRAFVNDASRGIQQNDLFRRVFQQRAEPPLVGGKLPPHALALGDVRETASNPDATPAWSRMTVIEVSTSIRAPPRVIWTSSPVHAPLAESVSIISAPARGFARSISHRPAVPPKLPSIWNGGWTSKRLGRVLRRSSSRQWIAGGVAIAAGGRRS